MKALAPTKVSHGIPLPYGFQGMTRRSRELLVSVVLFAFSAFQI